MNKNTKNILPQYIEQGFRWMRETISLIYSHHQHPLPMVALIFMYAETLGKPLIPAKSRTTQNKVSAFIKEFLPKLWNSFKSYPDREKILGDYYRNGLAHQIFMKQNCGIHENKSGDLNYVSNKLPNAQYSINIDFLVPEFLTGISKYYKKLNSNKKFLNNFENELHKGY